MRWDAEARPGRMCGRQQKTSMHTILKQSGPAVLGLVLLMGHTRTGGARLRDKQASLEGAYM